MILFPRIPLAEGLTVSRIVTGLWPLADRQKRSTDFDVDRAAMAMSPFVDAGLTTFDMADVYGCAEDIAGMFGERAERLTQWTPRPGPISPDDAREAVLRAMKRLRAERIDLMQFHASSFVDPSWLDALFQLQELRREGLIRHVGVANFDTAHLRIAIRSGVDLVSNQVSFSLIDSRAANGMTELCLAHNVRLLAYGTLLGGFLSDDWLGKPEPEWEQLDSSLLLKYSRFIRAAGSWSAFQKVLRALDEVASKHRASIAAVASRFVLDQPSVAAIVIGSDLAKSDHMADTVRVLGLGLDDEDRALLAKAIKHLKPIPGDCGDEYRRPPFLTAPGDVPHANSDLTAPYTVKPGPGGRTIVLTGTESERATGSPAAHRLDDRVWTSGLTAMHGDRPVGGTDARAQFDFVIDKIEGALVSLGASFQDVVRTRVTVRHEADRAGIMRAHADRFRHIMPATSFVHGALEGDAPLVEVEAEAVVPS